jgi:hypothetical protein
VVPGLLAEPEVPFEEAVPDEAAPDEAAPEGSEEVVPDEIVPDEAVLDEVQAEASVDAAPEASEHPGEPADPDATDG